MIHTFVAQERISVKQEADYRENNTFVFPAMLTGKAFRTTSRTFSKRDLPRIH